MDRRLWEVDALRGFMLVMMTITHLPTVRGSLVGQPFGYVSAAEGFVFLSGFMAGLIYGGQATRAPFAAVRHAMWRRAGVLYACHVGILLFLFGSIASAAVEFEVAAVTNLLSFYLDTPLLAAISAFALIYNPPLLDILPLYVLFLLVSPHVLHAGRQHGWRPVLLASFALWALAQFNAGTVLYSLLTRATGLAVPVEQTGAFETLAWQFLWVIGLWLGCTRAVRGRLADALPSSLISLAIVITVASIAARYLLGQTPWADQPVGLLLDKWRLGPLRLLCFFALLAVVIEFGPRATHRWRTHRWVQELEALGRTALPVFCGHLVIVLIALVAIGDRFGMLSWWQELLVVATALAVLRIVAACAALAKPTAARASRSQRH